ncbi:uncharacterized protein [Elaeis guineensis]|uniref:uncharacterized protein n=1 Tax=Elaeis guineensis var. tenera TaxID=51953 RepID=UPI003C6D9015
MVVILTVLDLKRKGGRLYVHDVESRKFRGFIQTNGLVDLDFIGLRFTWCNNRQRGIRVWKRIDRLFVTASGIQSHPTQLVCYLSKITSDHYSILFVTDTPISHRSPFRFEKVWLFYPRSWNIVREVWCMPVHGDTRYRVIRRLELMRRRFLRWNREEVGDKFRRFETIKTSIAELQE